MGAMEGGREEGRKDARKGGRQRGSVGRRERKGWHPATDSHLAHHILQ